MNLTINAPQTSELFFFLLLWFANSLIWLFTYICKVQQLLCCPLNRTETEYVSQILTKIKRFAQHHSCHVWFVAHPRQVNKIVITC
jgi:hypothetical protein